MNSTGKRRRGAACATSSIRVKSLDISLKAVRLRMDGKTYDEISEALGCSKGHAFNAVSRWMSEQREAVREGVAELRMIESERLEKIFEPAYELAKQGDLAAIDRCLRVMDRRAKLLGLDAPVVVQATVDAADESSYAAQLEQMSAEQLSAERNRLFGKN